MSNLKQLRSRIRSVKSTQKITKAMQLVSASKLAKVKNHIMNSAYYVDAVAHIMEDLLTNENLSDLPEREQNFFFEQHLDKPSLLIMVTSEKGLCGVFNSVIIKQVKADILKLEDSGRKIKLIIIGKKGYEALKINYSHYIDSYFPLSKSHDEQLILQIKNQIMETIGNAEASECLLYFNKFKNAMTQILVKSQILPITSYVASTQKTDNVVYEYEGKNLIFNVINLYINSQINYAILQSRASEEGARMTAMENATNNANEIMGKLILKLNRSRQSIITNELIEIIAGAEAL